jgi:DNA repair protein RadC
MILTGAGGLSNSELLAIILGTGARGASATALAEKLLALGGLGYLAESSPEELAAVRGVGDAKACRVLAAIELGKRVATRPRGKRVNIVSCDDIAGFFMADMRAMKNECFKVLLLNVKNEVIAVQAVSMGIINSSLIDPREVFRPAVKRGAASVALAHNHPSGNPEPSGADVDVTLRLVEAGKLLGIKVLDHIVIGDGVFVSMRQRQLI